MIWSQFARLLDAMGFPRSRSEMWADWAWDHFRVPGHKPLSTEEVILALGYVMQGRKAKAVWDIEMDHLSSGEQPQVDISEALRAFLRTLAVTSRFHRFGPEPSKKTVGDPLLGLKQAF